MSITVKISGHTKQLQSGQKYCFDYKPGMTIKDIFKGLSSRTGPDFSKTVYDEKNDIMNENMVVYVNSREIRMLCYTGTILQDGDIITIMPP